MLELVLLGLGRGEMRRWREELGMEAGRLRSWPRGTDVRVRLRGLDPNHLGSLQDQLSPKLISCGSSVCTVSGHLSTSSLMWPLPFLPTAMNSTGHETSGRQGGASSGCPLHLGSDAAADCE